MSYLMTWRRECYLSTLPVEVDNGPDFFRQAAGSDTLRDAVDEEDELALRRFQDTDAIALLQLVQVRGPVVLLKMMLLSN